MARHDPSGLGEAELEEQRARVRVCPHPTFGQLTLLVTQPVDLEAQGVESVSHLRLSLDPQVLVVASRV